MALTAEEAAKQVAAKIQEMGGWKPGNIFNALIGVGQANTAELQALLNDLLTKKGILKPEDEAAIKDLLAAQDAARKQRNQIRVRNGIVIGIVAAITGTLIYLSVKKKSSL